MRPQALRLGSLPLGLAQADGDAIIAACLLPPVAQARLAQLERAAGSLSAAAVAMSVQSRGLEVVAT